MCLVVILDGEESEKYGGLSLLVSGLLPGWYCWYWFVSAAICVSASISRTRVMAASMRDQEHSATSQ